MENLKTVMDSTLLTIKIGLEIHVQLKTKSKMFCRCDNNAEGKAPNTVVCPICLGMPGSLPVANEEAILSTLKTGLALNCEIAKISKFDRKHYFYPDLPKGYQISQYDEPFCLGGFLEIEGHKIRFNRIHLEEDAGKLIHANGSSLVDLNRAGTPLMEIVTEPDINSPLEAGAFLRRLQKIVRDETTVSEADMEKGHFRCDANISISDDDGKMSEIVELKNINSFRFIEKALTLEEERLKSNYPNWPKEKSKVTRGYDSKKNETYIQRTKEEASDYRYFPEPDLPPFETVKYNLEELKSAINQSEDSKTGGLVALGISESDAHILLSNNQKMDFFNSLRKYLKPENIETLSKVVVHNYLSFYSENEDILKELAIAIDNLSDNKISKQTFSLLSDQIQDGKSFNEAVLEYQNDGLDVENIIDKILAENSSEVTRYKSGAKQLMGYFVGLAMKESGGKADPKEISRILDMKLNRK